jgi:hypothetical protein
MEREEKSKKVAKEKRSVKKSKTVALPAKEIPPAPIAETPAVRKSIGTGSTGIAKRPIRSSKAKEPTYEQVQLRAYFIGERRKSLGISGDETSDWVQAEIELNAELASK